MSDEDTEIPEPADETDGIVAEAAAAATGGDPRQKGTDRTHEILGAVLHRLTAVERQVRNLTAADSDDSNRARSAPWVVYPPPAVTKDPRTNLAAFVEFYNTVYAGAADGRARRIPACWDQHPGLDQEISTLAATWRAANTGKTASPRDAQYWHHTWRPGFIDRMVRDWLHPNCLDGQHQPTGAPPRTDRFTAAEQAKAGGETTNSGGDRR